MFTGHFVLVDEIVHFFLKLIDNQVQFVSLIHFLGDYGLFPLEFLVLLVEIGFQTISVISGFHDLVLDVHQSSVFLARLIT